MAVQEPAKTGFEKWQDDINKASGDVNWDTWDCEIQIAVNEYNRHLSGTAGYNPLDWRLIKAMLWVETGANSSEWKIKPMQIGVSGDPGLTSFLSGSEGGDLILPSAWKGQLTMGSARTMPAHNIRAGIGYLLMRMATFEHRSVSVEDSKVHDVTVKPGDSLDKIAKAHGSTTEVLKKLNPMVGVLRPGQVLKCQKASVRRVITGWRPLSASSVALRYNSMRRDPNYAKKLDFAWGLVRKGTEASCTQ
ncbi:LysM peptidoglycan-binding domain-containing protein [Burkholderia ubonensis]|uniref:LysM peptidoglycan-binding domain-containing protein n=1 Tax=Burkholderia ubonensis TaxID=101571 RepID=UPI0009B489E2|nr:LysM domain-containing protein [Burkholderia ubonensis]